MAEIIVSGITSHCNLIRIPQSDAVQQLLTNLLAKKETILAAYDFQRLFRNYIWKIAENEVKNIIKAARRKKYNDSFNDDRSGKMNITINASENSLLIHDAIETFHCKVLTYLDIRYKLLLCLKVIFDQRIFPDDIKLLFGDKGIFSNYDFQTASSSLNDCEKSEKGKFHRFELIRPFLNYADHSATDANSYWRWTNNEINKLIHFLNFRHSMDFNRETFGYLLDRYFENSSRSVQL